MMLNASTAAIYTTWHWLPQWTRRKHWLQIEVLTPDMKWILLVFVVPSSILSLLIRQEAKYFANFTLIDQSLGHFVRTQWCINDEIGWYKVQRMGGTENYLELFSCLSRSFTREDLKGAMKGVNWRVWRQVAQWFTIGQWPQKRGSSTL